MASVYQYKNVISFPFKVKGGRGGRGALTDRACTRNDLIYYAKRIRAFEYWIQNENFRCLFFTLQDTSASRRGISCCCRHSIDLCLL